MNDQAFFSGDKSHVYSRTDFPGNQSGAHMGRATALDLNVVQFRVDNEPSTLELLRAIPKVPVDSAMQGLPNVTTSVVPELTFVVRRADGGTAPSPPTDPAFFNNATSPTAPSRQAFDTTDTVYAFKRIGQYSQLLQGDAGGASRATGIDASYMLRRTTEIQCYKFLDGAIGGLRSPTFAGLADLQTVTAATTDRAREAAAAVAAAVAVNGHSGPPGGADCLIMNNAALAALMADDSGTSGWRVDPRTGMHCYFHFGLPVYRCNIPTTSGNTYIFAANLGDCGLQLLYTGPGNRDSSFGFAWSPPDNSALLGTSNYLLSGEFCLIAWESTGLAKALLEDLA